MRLSLFLLVGKMPAFKVLVGEGGVGWHHRSARGSMRITLLLNSAC